MRGKNNKLMKKETSNEKMKQDNVKKGIKKDIRAGLKILRS